LEAGKHPLEKAVLVGAWFLSLVACAFCRTEASDERKKKREATKKQKQRNEKK
jgi:hypothetical protein